MSEATNGVPGFPTASAPDPMTAGIGAAAWADRADRPDLTLSGEPKIQPMSILPGFSIASRDPDPRGMAVYGGRGERVGVVDDIWVDRSEPQVRYYQIGLDDGPPSVLLPAGFAKIRKAKRRIDVNAIFAAHFAGVPRTKAPDQITLQEEDRIVAYYAGGTRFAEPARSEPLF